MGSLWLGAIEGATESGREDDVRQWLFMRSGRASCDIAARKTRHHVPAASGRIHNVACGACIWPQGRDPFGAYQNRQLSATACREHLN